jgi:hypothetical protein
MTVLGSLVIGLGSFLVVLWILHLVRKGNLYVGYAIVLLALTVATAVVTTVSPVRALAGRVLSSLFPAEPIAVLGLGGMTLLLIYVLHQLSVLADRVARLTQELALKDGGERPPGG